MPPPPFVMRLLGWRQPEDRNGIPLGRAIPIIADGGTEGSVAIATVMFELLAATDPHLMKRQSTGTKLEQGIMDFLAIEMPALDPHRVFSFDRKPGISAFRQYVHLAEVQKLIKADTTNTLPASLGRDYVIKPDVTVGLDLGDGGLPVLHASVSSKATIRSDRVQNIRHEANIMIRHRRGRLPHIVAVTAEPTPGRLASIARGTGEVDAVYHVALDELLEANRAVGTDEGRRTLDELVGQGRLLDIKALPRNLLA